ncbi:hypothetical protein ISN45_Aa03g035330 [Arabidopsis thaliana x Arabidopsis arenosa]|uniref:Uncharacterized protein n=1 Tax=Arabidopsis thaliana x Arabidopsis arenosa TaxID=1240361 RepID=A0A8T2AZ23_9BRAS|nr:hypothetical protein ISN45_Aa03g035330 [Arabidopsis thaliana x Arabidopsis arenosa]
MDTCHCVNDSKNKQKEEKKNSHCFLSSLFAVSHLSLSFVEKRRRFRLSWSCSVELRVALGMNFVFEQSLSSLFDVVSLSLKFSKLPPEKSLSIGFLRQTEKLIEWDFIFDPSVSSSAG